MVVLNLMHPCIFGANPINGEALLVLSAQTDRSILNDLKKAEAALDKNKSKKSKDPNNTAKAREELEAEGESVVEKQTVKMNEDKKGGTGTLKVRFDVTSPRKSFSESKNFSDSARSRSPDKEQ